MDKEQIKALALANGFKLKEQPDGNMDLNPYVYDFAKALINCDWIPVAERLPEYPVEVIVYIQFCFFGKRYNFVSSASYDNNAKMWRDPKYNGDKGPGMPGVTHWRPMPQRPEEGGE